MKKTTLIFALVLVMIGFGASKSYAYVCGTYGITYTSSNPWISANGTVTGDGATRNNDWVRLNWMLKNCVGKIIFDEGDYYLGTPPSGQAPSGSIPPSLPLFSYRIIEGNGRRAAYIPGTVTSRIIQTEPGKEIFHIPAGVNSISVRDLAMVGLPMSDGKPDGTIGILAYSTCLTGCTSTSFQFSNLTFSNLAKGIYVNADDPPTIPGNETSAHQWQFDNVRLDHAFFDRCTIGVHINSYNSGWNMSSLDFLIPAGSEQGDSTDITGKTYGVYLERSTYTSMDLLIGNGPESGAATALLYVKEHGNLSLQSSISEGFHDDVIVHGIDLNSPINLMNNTFMNGVRIKRATVFSSSNQYSAFNNHGADTVASDNAYIYSFGDKFCAHGDTLCDPGRGFTSSGGAGTVYMTTQNKNTTEVPSYLKNIMDISVDSYLSTDLPRLSVTAPAFTTVPLMRLGVRGLNYDFTRKESDGKLSILGTQNGYSGYSFEMCQSCNTDNYPTGTISKVTINNDGSVTPGTVSFSSLGTATNGTFVYCSNCQKATPCSGSGSGALAKRINGSWDCD